VNELLDELNRKHQFSQLIIITKLCAIKGTATGTNFSSLFLHLFRASQHSSAPIKKPPNASWEV